MGAMSDSEVEDDTTKVGQKIYSQDSCNHQGFIVGNSAR